MTDLTRRRFMRGAATAAAASTLAIPAIAASEPCPLVGLERQWLRCAAAESSTRQAMRIHFGGRSLEQISHDEMNEFLDEYRKEDSPVKQMGAVAAVMAKTPAKDRVGVGAKLRVALGRGRDLGEGCSHRVNGDLVASALADLERLPA